MVSQEIWGYILRRDREHHKDSDLHDFLWSKTSWESSTTDIRNEETQDWRSSEMFIAQSWVMLEVRVTGVPLSLRLFSHNDPYLHKL
ncbi:hypothetical protein TNCV_4828931 [Trichonephila clavipes]|nr:hypothetical protein TNCV_4828931 [Trichonephila clavipes]